MQSRFGLKDFLLLVLIIVVGVLVIMSMRQDDRGWTLMQSVQTKVTGLEQQIARLESRISDGLVVATPRGTDPRGAPATRDTSWARPDVPVTWHDRWTFARDPRGNPDFAPGGEFTEIFEAQPKKLTPILGEDTYSRRVQDQVVERLAEYDPVTLELRGVLAEAWQYDPDGMWLRVKLNPRARFSDGVPVTAEDARWTFHDFVMNPELETESIRSILGQINRFEVVDDLVFDIIFNEPGAYNLQAAIVFYVMPKHFYGEFSPSQINQSTGLLFGSGPFKMRDLDVESQWSPGQDAVLVRNEQYWGDKPALERLRFKTISDDLARLTAYRNGEGDMILPTSIQFARVVKEPGWEDDNYSLRWVNMRSGYSFVGWQCGERNGKLTPFHDRRVRLAMTHALDREHMIATIWEGNGEVAVGPNNPPSPAADPNIKPWPYDLDRARVLLGEAGWIDRDNDGILENERGDEFSFEFTISAGGQVSERIARYLQDQSAQVGIRCEPRFVDWSLYDQIMKTRDFDALILAWSATAPESDPSQIWHSDAIDNQGHNFIQWRHPKQDLLIEGLRTERDFEKRMEIFHEFHRVVHNDQPYTFLRVSPWSRFIKREFTNVHTYPKGLEQREYYVPMRQPAMAN